VEPSGAATAAALRAGLLRPPPTAPVVLIVSGGNVDPALLEGQTVYA
jgi:threonine dehydratase